MKRFGIFTLKCAFVAALFFVSSFSAKADIQGFLLSCGEEVYIETPGPLSDEACVEMLELLEKEYCPDTEELDPDTGEGN